MSESKQDRSLSTVDNQSQPITQLLNYSDIVSVFSNYLPVKELSRLVQVSTGFNQFFQTNFNKRTAPTYVVEGNPVSLIKTIILDPSQLFVIHKEIIAPLGQRYFNLSLFQLMTFLCDDDMKTQIMGLESVIEYLKDEKKKAIREQQYSQIDCGGADLIKLDQDPLKIWKEQGLKGLTHYKTTFTFYDNTEHEVTFPLLKNPDGIACYPDEHGEMRFCYINQADPENPTIESLDNYLILEEDKEEFVQFKASFDAMEMHSSCRSSIKQHKLIEKVFKHTLVQRGIEYEDKGIRYCDYRTPFNLVNALRKCVRLYKEGNWAEGDKCWRDEVGKAQGEEMWLLQRICEENRPFYPLNINHKDFIRCCMIEKYNANKGGYEKISVFDRGVVKISDLAIYKAPRGGAGRGVAGRVARCAGLVDLVAICWLIENAKENVIESKPEQEVQMNCTIR